MVSRAARRRWRGASEAKCFEIKLFNIGIDDADRIVFSDEVIQALWQQRHLMPPLTFDESRHRHLHHVCSTR